MLKRLKSRNALLAALVVVLAGIAGCGTFFINTNVTITTTTLPDGVINVPYSQTVTAKNGIPPYTWTVSTGTLPDGLSIGSTNGAITGTPTTAGPQTFTVTATDSDGNVGNGNLTLTIDSSATVSITTTSLPDGTVGTAYTATVTATGGATPYTWSITSGSLPPGLTGDPSTGAISGTPTKAGTSNFTVQVTDANESTATADLSIDVAAATSTAPAKSGVSP
jgi:hypothetical protein